LACKKEIRQNKLKGGNLTRDEAKRTQGRLNRRGSRLLCVATRADNADTKKR